MLTEKVKNFIHKNNLLSPDDKILVAFSGGADSMCLLHLFKSMSYNVSAAHLNHMLRGENADKDEECAKNFCKKYDIPFYSKQVDIAELSKKSGISEETAGRNERYKFFSFLKKEHHFDKIATAHNKNDNAETILMHFLRGSGQAGLSGIPVKRNDIIRPILSCTRKEIEEYCEMHNLQYVTDSTNFELICTRNKIRLDLLPYLEKEFNSNIINTICNLGDILSEENAFLKKLAEEKLCGDTDVFIDILNSCDKAVARHIVMMIGKNAGISPEYKHIDEILALAEKEYTGKSVCVPGGSYEVSYKKLVAKKSEPLSAFCFKVDENTNLSVNGYTFMASTNAQSPEYFVLPQKANIVLRNKLPGDKILLRGMTKKISDIFTDKKIPRYDRCKIPILLIDGEIAAIIGVETGDLLAKPEKINNSFVLNISNKEYNNE